MSNDDRRSEQFIREVDEELRRAQLKAIWDRFAPLIIGVCVLIVAVTAGYRGWEWWQARRAAEAGDRYLAALQKIESDNRSEGEAELAKIAEAGGSYAALARLRLAGEKAASGEKKDAVAAYDAVAADGSVPGALRDLARVRAAILALDLGDLAGAKQRAEPLDAAGNAWRHAAREVLGMAAYQTGDLKRARDIFTEIQQDAETPPDLWVRANVMVALIDGQLAAPSSEDAAKPPAGESGAFPAGGAQLPPSAASDPTVPSQQQIPPQ
jgi:hypothetical protein